MGKGFVTWAWQSTETSNFHEFFWCSLFKFGQLIEFLHGFAIYSFKTSPKNTFFAFFEKRFFHEKTRAEDVQNQLFYYFFHFLNCPPAENNLLGDTFLLFIFVLVWPFTRKNSSGGHFLIYFFCDFLLQAEIFTRVFTVKNHFSPQRDPAGTHASWIR